MPDISHKLQTFFETHLPITDYMGLAVDKYDGSTLSLKAPLAPNINDKQTAFGGSLYNACVMTCWGFAYLKSIEANIQGNQVVAAGSIKYKAPVDSDYVAVCESPSQEVLDHFIDGFKRHGKGLITLKSTITCNGKIAVEFEGTYAVLK
jgi:thioesterase domain-containing protein